VKFAAAALLATFALCVWARDTSHFVDKLSCGSGPYGLKLPKTYDELRRIAPLKGEKVVREQDLGPYKARYVDLIFNGLRLGVVTHSNSEDGYQVTSAEIRSPQWRIAGPFRFGQALPPRVGDVETKALSPSATVEFSGDEDTVRVKLKGRRIHGLTYLCLPD
jgi:hypothetical protein